MNNEISDSDNENENIKRRRRKKNKDSFFSIVEENKKRGSSKNLKKLSHEKLIEEEPMSNTAQKNKDGEQFLFLSDFENDIVYKTEKNKVKDKLDVGKSEEKYHTEKKIEKVKKVIVPKQIFINKNAIEDKRKNKLEEEEKSRIRDIEKQFEIDRIKEKERIKEIEKIKEIERIKELERIKEIEKEKLKIFQNKSKIQKKPEKEESNQTHYEPLKDVSQIKSDPEDSAFDFNNHLMKLIPNEHTSSEHSKKDDEKHYDILETLEQMLDNKNLLKDSQELENLSEIEIKNEVGDLTPPQKENLASEKNLHIRKRTEIKRLTVQQKQAIQDRKSRNSQQLPSTQLFSYAKGLTEHSELTPEELKKIDILKKKLQNQSQMDKHRTSVHRLDRRSNQLNSNKIFRKERGSTVFEPAFDRHFSSRRETEKERTNVLSLLNTMKLKKDRDSSSMSSEESVDNESNSSYKPYIKEEAENTQNESSYVIPYDNSDEDYEELMSPMKFDQYDKFYNKQSYNKLFEDDEANNMKISNKQIILYKDRLINNYFNEKKILSMPKFLKISEKDKKCQEIMTYTDLKIKEKTDNFYDKYWCIELRRRLFWLCSYISKICKFIVANQTWDNISLAIILVNTLFLLISNPLQSNSIADVSDNYFLYFYTLEMFLKIFAFGFVLPDNSYIKDPWNVLDFTVIVVGWISFFLEILLSGNKIKGLSGLRAFRILRPLKTIKSIKGLRTLLVTLMKSIVSLADLALILFFFFLIFSIAGVQMWQGLSMKRCMSLNLGYFYDFSNSTTLCTYDSDCFLFTQPGNNFICAKAYAPVWPENNVINFDNLITAFITVFVIGTMEGWSDSWSYVTATFKDQYGINVTIIFLYYHIILFAGGYYLISLFLAVIKSKFTDQSENKRIQADKRSFFELIKAKYVDDDQEKELKISKESDLRNSQTKNIEIKLKLNDQIKKIKEKTFFIKKTPNEIDVNYNSFKDMNLLKGFTPEEKYNLSNEIQKEAYDIKNEFKNKINDAISASKEKIKQTSSRKDPSLTRQLTIQKTSKAKIEKNEMSLAKRKGTVYYGNAFKFNISKKLIAPAIEMTLESLKQDIIDNKIRKGQSNKERKKKSSLLKNKGKKSKNKIKNMDVTILEDTSFELLINNNYDEKVEDTNKEGKANNELLMTNLPTNITKTIIENANDNPPSSSPYMSEYKIEESALRKIENIEEELSIFTDDSDEVEENENLKTQLGNRKTLQKMKTLHSKHTPEEIFNTNKNPATLSAIDSNNKIYNLVSIKNPNSILTAIQKHKDEMAIKKKVVDKRKDFQIEDYVNEMKPNIKNQIGKRKSYLKVLKFFEDKKNNEDIILLTESEAKETKKMENTIENSLEISLFQEENLFIDTRSYSDLDMIPNTYKDDESYIQNLDIDELCKNNENNKFTRIARNSLYNARNGKRNTTILSENFGELFFSKINASLKKNIVIDMKETRKGVSRAITRKLRGHSALGNKIEFTKSVKKEPSKELTALPIERCKSQKIYKASSVEKNLYKYPQAVETGVDTRNLFYRNVIHKKKENIPEHLRDKRKYMKYVYNLMDKDFTIQDKFKADYCAVDVLGVKEKKITRIIKPKETNPILLFNSSQINLKTQAYIRYRKFKLLKEEYNYHNHMMKNLTTRTIDIFPIKSKHFGMNKKITNLEIDFTVRSLAKSTSNNNGALTHNNYGATMHRSKSTLTKASIGPGNSLRLIDQIKYRKNLNEKVHTTLNKLNYNTLSYYFLEDEDFIKKIKKEKNENDKFTQLFKDKENSIEVRQQISKIKVYDIETNSRKYVEWSGVDVLNIPQNEKKFSEWNSKISKLEEINVILWKKSLLMNFLQYIRYGLFLIANSQILDFSILLVVILNAITMSLDGNLFLPEFSNYLNIANYAFNGIFIAEFFIKFIGLGPILYFSDPFTYLDVFIIAFAILDMSTSSSDQTVITSSKVSNVSSKLAFLRVFRIFRVLRFTKVLRKIKAMRKIFKGIKKSLASVSYIVVIVLIFLFIFQLLGMSLLNDFQEFADFWAAFYLVFQIMSIENWNIALINLYQINELSVLYLIIWIVLGNFILFNLLISVLLDSFDDLGEDDDEEELNTEYDKRIRALMPQIFKKYELAEKDFRYRAKKKKMKGKGEKNQDDPSALKSNSQRVSINKSNLSSSMKSNIKKTPTSEDEENLEEENELELIDKDDENVDLTGSTKLLHDWFKANALFKNNECEYSLFIFSQTNKIRIAMMKLIKWKRFDQFILVLIGLSTLRLISDTFISGYTSDLLFDLCDIVFTLLYTFEMVSKIISLGFAIGEGTYIQDNWNKIDFTIIIVSFIDFAAIIQKYTGTEAHSNLNFLKVLRLLRLLRPLRFISRNVQLKLIITSLFDSIVPILNGLFVVFVVFYMFSIVGINLFYEMFHTCYYAGPLNYNPVANFTDLMVANNITNDMPSIENFCISQGGTMDASPSMSFANIFQSLVSCFVLSNMESWNQFMHMYSVFSVYYGLFFVIYLLVVSYFFLNLFQAIMFSCFHDAWTREKKKGIQNNQSAETYWDYLKQIEFAKPEFSTFKIPEKGLRKIIYDMARSKLLENLVMGVIILNIVIMAMNYEGSTDYYNSVLDSINLAFTSVFIAECMLKLTALGIRGYFYYSWNKFDFFVVSSSIVDIVITNSTQANSTFLKSFQVIRVLRVLRLTRILRVLKSFKGLSKLLQTLKWSIGELWNVFLLFFLIICIWAIMGCYLFDGITYDKYRNKVQIMNSFYNFDNFYYAFILAIRSMTGESWPQMMYELQYIDQSIITPYVPLIYYLSLIFILNVIMLNLFISVTLQQYDEFMAKKENPIEQFEELLIVFKESWNKFCTAEDKGYKMKRNVIANFFYDFNWKKCTYNRNMDDIRKYIMSLELLNDHQNYVYFHDVLFKLIRHEIGRHIQNKSKLTIIKKEEERLNKLIQFRIRKHIQETQRIKIKLVGNQLNKFNPLTSHLYYKISYYYMMYFLNHYEDLEQKLYNKEHYETLDGHENEKSIKLGGEEDSILIEEEAKRRKYFNINEENDFSKDNGTKINAEKIDEENHTEILESMQDNVTQSFDIKNNSDKIKDDHISTENRQLFDICEQSKSIDTKTDKNAESLKLIGIECKNSFDLNDKNNYNDEQDKSGYIKYSSLDKVYDIDLGNKLIMKENKFSK